MLRRLGTDDRSEVESVWITSTRLWRDKLVIRQNAQDCIRIYLCMSTFRSR